MTAPKKPCDRI